MHSQKAREGKRGEGCAATEGEGFAARLTHHDALLELLGRVEEWLVPTGAFRDACKRGVGKLGAGLSAEKLPSPNWRSVGKFDRAGGWLFSSRSRSQPGPMLSAREGQGQ